MFNPFADMTALSKENTGEVASYARFKLGYMNSIFKFRLKQRPYLHITPV